ncbi:MAG: NAD-dependent dehydratase, partial [Clostridia bacterium]|nr:NAD-dependent dehydratase [Clostridia bacterium]
GLMGNHHAIGEAFQITSDETLTWNQIYETIADALGVTLNAYHVSSDFLADIGSQYDYRGSLIGDKSNSVVFENQKLKQIVPQMTTCVPFHVGARKSLAYLLSHPECQVEDPEFDAFCDRVIAAIERAKQEVLG